MKAVIHIGLHKTGTTYIQHLANKNHLKLKNIGIYYEPMPGYPAHHHAAWKLLRGDTSAIATMAKHASESKSNTLFISSEDLESLIFRPDITDSLINTIQPFGVDEVIFVIYIRRQDKLFMSHYSELSKHLYVDPFQMFYDIMRLGYLFIDKPNTAGDSAPFWYFCFDHYQFITAFQNQLRTYGNTSIKTMVYNFDDFAHYPGDALFDYLNAEECLESFPDSSERNARLTNKEIVDGFSKQMKSFTYDMELSTRKHVNRLIKSRITLTPLAIEAISKRLITKYGNGNSAVLHNR